MGITPGMNRIFEEFSSDLLFILRQIREGSKTDDAKPTTLKSRPVPGYVIKDHLATSR